MSHPGQMGSSITVCAFARTARLVASRRMLPGLARAVHALPPRRASSLRGRRHVVPAAIGHRIWVERLRWVVRVPGGALRSPGAGRLVNCCFPENSTATSTGGSWRWRPSITGAGAANGQALGKPQVQVLVFRCTAALAMSDSAPHAVHERRRPSWFVAVRWPRQAGMTLLTRRPLPSDRRPMPSCL